MQITAQELTELMASTHSDAKEVAALRERVLKLEQTTRELLDLLTDFRVNQVMGKNEECPK